MNTFQLARKTEINKEWWILLSLFTISALISSFGALNYMLLLLYVLPTLFSAYFLGRRHAVLTAFASVFLVVCGLFLRNTVFLQYRIPAPTVDWWQILVWGIVLVIFGYATGSLFREMHEMYRGFLLMLRYFLTRDPASHDHLRRISYLAGMLAEEMKLNSETVENARSAALLYDLHAFELHPELLRKLSRLSSTAHVQSGSSAKKDYAALARLCKVLPLIVNNKGKSLDEIPVESRLVALAEEYDQLTHNEAGVRTALSPEVARNVILRGAGTKFDSAAVDAFVRLYKKGKLFPAAEAESVLVH